MTYLVATTRQRPIETNDDDDNDDDVKRVDDGTGAIREENQDESEFLRDRDGRRYHRVLFF